MIFPVSDQIRERIQRRQHENEPGWDAPIPADDDRRVIPFNNSCNDFTKRDQPTLNAARLPGVVLDMPLHPYLLLCEEALIACAPPDAQQHRGEPCEMKDRERVRD